MKLPFAVLRKSALKFTKGSKRENSISYYFLLFWFNQNSISVLKTLLSCLSEKTLWKVNSEGLCRKQGCIKVDRANFEALRGQLASFWDSKKKFLTSLCNKLVGTQSWPKVFMEIKKILMNWCWDVFDNEAIILGHHWGCFWQSQPLIIRKPLWICPIFTRLTSNCYDLNSTSKLTPWKWKWNP